MQSVQSAVEGLPHFPFISEIDFGVQLGEILRLFLLGGIPEALVQHKGYVRGQIKGTASRDLTNHSGKQSSQ
jgi:hypothetical protein